MPRFNEVQHVLRPAKVKKEARNLPKPGKYTSKDLESAKKIISPEGGKR